MPLDPQGWHWSLLGMYQSLREAVGIPGMLLAARDAITVSPGAGLLWGRTHSKFRCKRRDISLLHPLTQ